MAQHDRLDRIIPEWNERVENHIAAFHARNSLRNDPHYVLEVDGRMAQRKLSETAQQADAPTDSFDDSVGSDKAKQRWFKRTRG